MIGYPPPADYQIGDQPLIPAVNLDLRVCFALVPEHSGKWEIHVRLHGAEPHLFKQHVMESFQFARGGLDLQHPRRCARPYFRKHYFPTAIRLHTACHDGQGTITLDNGKISQNSGNWSFGNGKLGCFQQGSLQVVIMPESSAAFLGSVGMLLLLRLRRTA